MGLCYDLPVYKDTYDLVLKIFKYTKNFPREYKYTLGQDMKRDSLVLLKHIYRANRSFEKKKYLENFLDEFEILKLEIKLSGDMKILSLRKQSDLLLLTNKIGKQITGWSKS